MSINFYKENFLKISLLQSNYDLDKISHFWLLVILALVWYGFKIIEEIKN